MKKVALLLLTGCVPFLHLTGAEKIPHSSILAPESVHELEEAWRGLLSHLMIVDREADAEEDEFTEEEFEEAKQKALSFFPTRTEPFWPRLEGMQLWELTQKRQKVSPEKACRGYFPIDPKQPGQNDPDEDPFLAPPELPANLYTECLQFSDLPLLDWEKQIIAYIISTMADKNVFQLLLDKTDMQRKGKKIHHVHPLCFIGYVASDSRLKKAMKIIRKNPFKWTNFLDGFAGKVREEAGRNNITRFIPGFAEMLKVDPAEVAAYLQKGDCEGLVIFLTSS